MGNTGIYTGTCSPITGTCFGNNAVNSEINLEEFCLIEGTLPDYGEITPEQIDFSKIAISADRVNRGEFVKVYAGCYGDEGTLTYERHPEYGEDIYLICENGTGMGWTTAEALGLNKTTSNSTEETWSFESLANELDNKYLSTAYFQKYDKDGDGVLSKEEHDAYINGVIGRNYNTIKNEMSSDGINISQEEFKKYDYDKNNLLSEKEYSDYLNDTNNKISKQIESYREYMNNVDANHDGQISSSEASVYNAKLKQEEQDHIDNQHNYMINADTNNDGQISSSEATVYGSKEPIDSSWFALKDGTAKMDASYSYNANDYGRTAYLYTNNSGAQILQACELDKPSVTCYYDITNAKYYNSDFVEISRDEYSRILDRITEEYNSLHNIN